MTTLCINLDSRPDRWEQAQREFAKWGYDVKRLSGISGDNPPRAFNESVLKAMRAAEGDLLLFEDDVVLTARPPAYAPEDALTVHFGCNITTAGWRKPEPYNEDYARLWDCWQSHATWYSAEAVAMILQNFTPESIIFDEWLRVNILPLGRSYVCKPMVAYQRPSRSDIWNVDANYVDCFHQGNKYLDKL